MRKALVCVLVALAVTAVSAGAAGNADSECFGAAARDPAKPQCAATPLRFTVTPAPEDALLESSAPCKIIRSARPEVCQFGKLEGAKANFALMGDSHAVHWRAALAHVAAKKGWRGLSITRSGCPFTLARTTATNCAAQTRTVLKWFKKHPEISTVIVSANRGRGVIASPGMTREETKFDGYRRAWEGLPSTVRRIYVIADVPHAGDETADCVTEAVSKQRDAGERCSRLASIAFKRDVQAEAAELDPSDRVELIDLNSFMCDAERCFPVVGGALVIKDYGHLTRTFSTTLGPYLRRAIDRLLEAEKRKP